MSHLFTKFTVPSTARNLISEGIHKNKKAHKKQNHFSDSFGIFGLGAMCFSKEKCNLFFLFTLFGAYIQVLKLNSWDYIYAFQLIFIFKGILIPVQSTY